MVTQLNTGRFAGECINIPWMDLEDVIIRLVETNHHFARNAFEEVEQCEKKDIEIPLEKALRKMQTARKLKTRDQSSSRSLRIALDREIESLKQNIASLTDPKRKLAKKYNELNSIVEHNEGKTSFIYLNGQRY
jgi:DNA polymerase II small subunit/DNA polymerase delta subunit B